MDIVDKAQLAEEREYERIFSSHEKIRPAIDDEEWRTHYCIDCKEEIPQARASLGYTLRCVECAELFDKKYRNTTRGVR